MSYRLLLMGGAQRMRAPEDDAGSEYDEVDEIDELDEEADPDEEQDEDQDDEPIDEGDVDDAPPARPTRGENRVAAATKKAAAAEARAAVLERDLLALRQAQHNNQQQLSHQQIQERLAQMEPWERTEYLRQVDAQNNAQAIQQLRFEQIETADKAAYEALCARKPIAEKLKDAVEKQLAMMRQNGTTAPRENVLRYVIGERALANQGRATGKAQRSANANLDRQTARPSGGRGDAAVSDPRRANSAAARAKRLENMTF